MNADEIVRALRCNWKCSKEKCDGCKYLYIEEGGMGVCKAKNHIYYNAADLIESLTAQLAELTESGFCASFRIAVNGLHPGAGRGFLQGDEMTERITVSAVERDDAPACAILAQTRGAPDGGTTNYCLSFNCLAFPLSRFRWRLRRASTGWRQRLVQRQMTILSPPACAGRPGCRNDPPLARQRLRPSDCWPPVQPPQHPDGPNACPVAGRTG